MTVVDLSASHTSSLGVTRLRWVKAAERDGPQTSRRRSNRRQSKVALDGACPIGDKCRGFYTAKRMIFYYAALVSIGVISSYYLRWLYILPLSIMLMGAAFAAMHVNHAPHALLHAAIGLVVVQFSYAASGVATEVVRDLRQSRVARKVYSDRKSEPRERNYRMAPRRLRRRRAW